MTERAHDSVDTRERTLETIIETASAGILVRNAAGKVVRVNKAFCAMLGYTKEELLGTDVFAVSHPDEAATDEAFRQELIAGKEVKLRRSKRYQRKNGEFVPVDISISTLLDADGNVEATVAIIVDMTETIQLRQEVQRREELHRAIVRHIPNAAIFLYDNELRFIAAEGERVRSGDVDANAIVGRLASEITPPENRERILAQYRATLTGEARADEYAARDRAFAVHTVPVRDESGGIVAGMIFSYDITEQHRQAIELRAATTRLAALIDHLSAGVIFEDGARR